MKPTPLLSLSVLALIAAALTSHAQTATLYRWTDGNRNWANAQWSLSPDVLVAAVTPVSTDLVVFNANPLNTQAVISETRANRAAHGFVFRTTGTVGLVGGNGDYNLEIFGSGITVEAGAGAATIGGAAGSSIQPRLRASQTWTNNSANVLTVNGGGSNVVMWLAPTVATPGDLVLTLSGTGGFALPTIQFRGVVTEDVITQGAALAYTSGVTISGDLKLQQELTPIALIFNPAAALTVTGTTSFLSGTFGIPNLIGLDGNTIDFGTYSIISGNVDLTNVVNVGPGDAFDIGGGKWAHFTSEPSGLQVVVAVPEPALLAGLFGLAALGLVLLRRRA